MNHTRLSSRSYNRITVDATALQTNYRILQRHVGSTVRIMAMVKADAYGHGMIEAAASFAGAGCDAFGVAELEEAITLRRAGIKGQIFVLLGFRPSEAPLFFEYDLTPVIFDAQALEPLSRAAAQYDRTIDIHLKIDCGMGRLGILPTTFQQFLSTMSAFPRISLAGIMSHFPLADDATSGHTREMYTRYKAVCALAGEKTPVLCHIANSGATLYFPETRCDMIRLGISLYGYYPDGAQAQADRPVQRLVPAMSFTTQVIQVKSVPAGTGISYGHTFVTDKDTRLAILPIGYADGFLRPLSNTAQVLIRGQRVRIIGRVCMNLCMADISRIPDVQPGDQVVILGSQGTETITADDIAAWMGTISYEVLCLFGNNNERATN